MLLSVTKRQGMHFLEADNFCISLPTVYPITNLPTDLNKNCRLVQSIFKDKSLTVLKPWAVGGQSLFYQLFLLNC